MKDPEMLGNLVIGLGILIATNMTTGLMIMKNALAHLKTGRRNKK